MNRKHMVAGSEVDKRQDFTIKYVQGWELTNTKFEHGNMVPGISEVIWGWKKGLLESGIGQKLISNSLWVLWDLTKRMNPDKRVAAVIAESMNIVCNTDLFASF